MAPKQADLEAQKAQIDVQTNAKDVIILSNGKKVRIGMIMNPTQDKLNELFVRNEEMKKKIVANDPKSEEKANKETRKYFAKAAAAILINNYFGLKLIWPIKWRSIYYLQNWSGDDFLNIIVEAKKKATEQQYSLGMALLVTMTDMWTTMTKKEAEEYRAELELVKEHRSLKNSQVSDNH